MRVNGLTANGARIQFDQPSTNVVNLTAASANGSCPYLISWSEEEGWIEHGKVLHKGNGKPQEYTDVFTFEGFRSRFKLEEREPEVAFIDHAALRIALTSGETMVLAPDDTNLRADDGEYMKLYWGDVAEFVFKLPDGVEHGEILESQLTLTGYYERYSAIMAAISEPSGKLRNVSMLQSRRKVAAFCEIPGRSRQPLSLLSSTGDADRFPLQLKQDK